jgi:hypothetical protein
MGAEIIGPARSLRWSMHFFEIREGMALSHWPRIGDCFSVKGVERTFARQASEIGIASVGYFRRFALAILAAAPREDKSNAQSALDLPFFSFVYLR